MNGIQAQPAGITLDSHFQVQAGAIHLELLPALLPTG